MRAMLRKVPPKAQNKTELPQLPTVVVFNNTTKATAEAAMYVEVVEEEKADETVWFIAAPTSNQLPWAFNDTARAIVQTMTQRDKEYLLSHNTRRKDWQHVMERRMFLSNGTTHSRQAPRFGRSIC